MTLELQEVKIDLPDAELVAPISMTIAPGDIATVMGPSGCGKSTLLSAISGNLSQVFTLSGNVQLDGQSVLDIPMEKRRIGMLFQDDLLFPHLDIKGNLGFAIPEGVSRVRRREIINDALERAGLEGFADRDPATLSGGQRARVSLLRSLLAEPKALLLDEPFSKLDQKLKDQIRAFVFEQIRQMNIPALLVTHDPDDCPGGMMINLENNRIEPC